MYIAIILLWILLNGRFTGEILVFGVLLGVVVSLFASRVVGYSLKNDQTIRRNLPLFIHYAAVLIIEIMKASYEVTLLSFGFKKPDPVLIEFHSGFETNMQNVLLANSITLTPGTITVFQEGDHFVVHCLRKEYGEGIEECVFVQLIRKMKME
ncbi:MAG: Na+/H+ antiporter subunit E [Lachnospiraceae bacterium]|nr:Na+/H+ antiporter subunit E [Lachnospiraceae bacterium]